MQDYYNKLSLQLRGHYPLNSLSNDKILEWSKLKAFAEDKINVNEKLKFGLRRIKTLWEKEKMLVTSIFSFSHNAFKRLLI